MKKTLNLTSLLSAVLIVLAFGPAFGQSGFSSGDGGFSIDIPRAGVKVTDKDINENGREGYGHVYEWSKQGEHFYQVGYFKMSKKLTPVQKTRFVNEFKGGILGEAKKNGSAATEKPYTFLRHRGVELRVVFPLGISLTRCFATDTRFYFISISLNNAFPEAGAVKILDSFRFLDAAALKKVKIEEATPEPLPQEPATKRLTTDAQDENLKGKVKSVIEEMVRLPGTRRIRSREWYFGPRGELTRQIEFMDDYPDLVKVWGYIDGNRVSDQESIFFEDDQRQGPVEIIQSLMESPMQPAGATQFDPRYSIKYAYKYDEKGRLIETATFASNGDPSDRTSFSYTGNRIDERSFWSDGQEIGHNVYILDADGNPIEIIEYNENDKAAGSNVYKYQFDATGNWILKRVFEKKIVRGKAILKPVSIYYRTITYYP